MNKQILELQSIYNNDPKKALLVCKKWSNLGKSKKIIITGASCITNPTIYAQMGYNIDDCINKAILELGKYIKVL
jgi:hypothetical protein